MLFRKEKTPADRPVPTHIAIVMDGNGRWAKKRGLPRQAGHKVGAEAFRTIANYAKTIGLKYLTVYAFSTENWKRSEEEVNAIMDLLEKYLREAIADMDKNRVRFCFFGDLTQLSPELQEELTQERFSDLLYSAGVPDPELVIRPGGELRTSNFLLWQSAYAEYYFTDVLWPDFGPKDLEKAIAAYNGRNRRFGGAK